MSFIDLLRNSLSSEPTGNTLHDTERGQAKVRLYLTVITIIYLSFRIIIDDEPVGYVPVVVFYMSCFFVISIVRLLVIAHKPDSGHRRRVTTMLLDYSSIVFVMSVASEMALPMYALILWITVGNGMRFGSQYLTLATIMALVSLAIIAGFNPYLYKNPDLLATLFITAVIVPAYAHVLLRRTRQASEEAVAANVAKSRFLAQASHDLRQPVHAISLFTACLHDAGLRPDERRMVENIDRSLHSVSRLFRSLLDISTLDSGTQVSKPEIVSINELLEDIVHQNFKAAEWSNVNLTLVKCSNRVLVDPALLSTMLLNIVSNALKYAPNRNVLIGCRHRRGKLTIEVHDQGPGISAEDLPLVYDEFYRAGGSTNKNVDGVGLGLSIVKRLSVLMGLTINIRSTLNQGTVVSVGGIEIVSGKLLPSPPSHMSLPVPCRV